MHYPDLFKLSTIFKTESWSLASKEHIAHFSEYYSFFAQTAMYWRTFWT